MDNIVLNSDQTRIKVVLKIFQNEFDSALIRINLYFNTFFLHKML